MYLVKKQLGQGGEIKVKDKLMKRNLLEGFGGKKKEKYSSCNARRC
jgi:hypothetical protein